MMNLIENKEIMLENVEKVTPKRVQLKKNGQRKTKVPDYIEKSIKTLFGYVDTERAYNSCGITEIDDLCSSLNQILESLKTDKQREEFFNYLDNNFKKELNKRIKRQDCMKTISLVTGVSSFNTFFQYKPLYFKHKDRIEGILTKHASYTSDERKNPNSGNMIKLWVF